MSIALSLPPPTSRHVGDYLLGAELGRGGMSVVYRATRGEETYALKMTAKRPTTDSVDLHLQFRREAAAVARLDHPSLVRVVELGETAGRPYLVMDLVEGESLDKRIARSPLDEDETLTLAKALTAALAEVHRFGLVHRDVKPANIVMGPAGSIKLIDFGLVTGETDTGAVVGTMQYAAPEQVGVLKRAVGAPADLYSLGATLFECLSGRPPIQGDNQVELLHHLAAVPAPDIRSLRPATSPALAAILSKLLSKDPDDRYQNARGLLADLEALPSLDEALRAGRPPVLGARDTVASSDQDLPLVGRKDELSRLERAFAEARSGRVTFAHVDGEGGSGKSRLVRELVTVLANRGAVVLSGVCQDIETAPFGPLREAVDRYLSRVFRLPEPERQPALEQVRRAAGVHASLVRRLSAGLARALGDTEQLRALDPDAEQQRYFEVIAGFFRNLGSPDAPLLLVIADIQWLDDSSLSVLERLSAGVAGHLLVVTTCRSDGGSKGTRARFMEALGDTLSERLELAPFGPEDAFALIAARLGGKPLDRPLCDKLCALTHGNPLALGEYLRALLDGGLIRPSGGRWVGDPDALDAVTLPRDVLDLMVGRLSSLRAATTRLVGIAGVVGARFPLELLASVSGAGCEEVARAVEELVHAGLVERTDSKVYAWVHDRVRAAAMERLSEEERREAHQAIAQAMDTSEEPLPEELYALARHYAQGQVGRRPRRACEVNLAAGLRALEEHANEEAFELLDRAAEMARQAGTYDEVALELLEGLGRACAMTGRLERAFDHLEEALRRARDRADRFRLQYLLTLTYASQGRNDEALASLYEAFRVMGRPYPRTTAVQVLVLVATWTIALLLRWTGIGYGCAKGHAREQRRVLSQLHYAGSMIGLFQGRPVLMVQFIVRDLLNVHFLGPTPETAVAYSVYGAVLGTFQLRSVMSRYVRLGIGIAEQIGDKAALAVCHAYQAMGTKWSGDLVLGNRMLNEALPELHRYLPGSWYAAMMICEQAYSYLHAGRSSAAIAHVRANLSQLERTHNLMFRYNTMSVLSAELMVEGEVAEATELWSKLEEQYRPLAKTIYVGLARCIASLEVMVNEEETGPQVDEQIDAFQQLLSEDYYSSAARVLAGYARMAQLLAAKEDQRKAARRRFQQATLALSLRAMAPVFRCHALLFRAVLARTEGDLARAGRLLESADILARRCESRRGTYHVALERARLAAQKGDSASGCFAQLALDVALSERWRRKAQRVRAEFGLHEQRPAAPTSHTVVPAGTTVSSLDQTRRYADALLQVSLASASVLDPAVQAKNALTELARVLGAERALFFLLNPASGELELTASTAEDAHRISQTVVRKVLQTRKPLVLTGTEDGEAIGSQSIAVYGLRSIMAAPLLLRDRLVGVVYLDSRLAKGMFTQDDVAILLGVSNHIAIAVETARAARLEAERSALARDMEVLGAVQTLLLPKTQVFASEGLRGAAFYQPAMQCGGDWWWHETHPDGRALIVLGDVSGHGAGPAMVSSAVAGAFHTMRALRPDADPPDLLAEIDRRVRAFEGGFHMTMSVVWVDSQRREISLWNAAGPEAFVVRGGKCQCISAPGSVLGDQETLQVGHATVPLGPGDRLLLCTDGVLELKRPNGRPLGPRRVSQMIAELASLPLADARARFGEELNRVLAGRPQEDDITFVMVEVMPLLLPQP